MTDVQGIIDIKMGWTDCLIPLLTVYAEGSAKGRADALAELRRMARNADAYTAIALKPVEFDQADADQYQLVQLVKTDNGNRWQFIAHGAAYSQSDAIALAERIEARGGIVRLLPV